MIETRDGLPLSSEVTSTASALDEAIESYLATRADTPRIIRQILVDDPDNLMARCLMGYLTKLAGDRVNGQRAAKLQRALASHVEGGAGSAWERSHVTALGMWVDEDLDALLHHFETMLNAYPHDALSLRMLHYLYFYHGDSRQMRDSVGARLDAYAGHRLEGYIEGMYAFGLEEAGDYVEAERFGRRAVERNPMDLWATHAVAHVMQMQGRVDEGIRWLQDMRPQWADGNNFRFHLCWHESLFHLAAGDLEQVLIIYDEDIAPAVQDDFYLDLCNASSLLLRLEAAGCEVGERWQPLAEIAEQHVQDAELVFASLHYLMPLLKTRSAAADVLMATLHRWASTDTDQGHVVRDVALDVAAFLGALNNGERARAAALQRNFRADLHRIGGSHAQRELFDLIA
ncbi:MAG: tetratricopeptide repeat protein [Gammaproteobacteria bacterium]|nr:MAG: tetratricopeptide repeat protein [Gammaproteobacteria bacterium]